jgi:hypothetical protein
MVCVRCKMAVASVLQKLNIDYKTIELGWVQMEESISVEQQQC